MGRFCRRITDGMLCMKANVDSVKPRVVFTAIWDTLILTIVLMCGIACFAIVVQETSFANRDLQQPYIYDSPPWRNHWSSGSRLLHSLSCLMFLCSATMRFCHLYYKKSIRATAFFLVLLLCGPLIAVGCTMMALGGQCPVNYPVSLMCYEMGFVHYSVFLTVLMFTLSYILGIIAIDTLRKLQQGSHLDRKVTYTVA